MLAVHISKKKNQNQPRQIHFTKEIQIAIGVHLIKQFGKYIVFTGRSTVRFPALMVMVRSM